MDNTKITSASIDSVMDSSYAVFLAQGIKRIKGSEESTDVRLKIEGQTFQCHRFLLQLHSSYFRTLLYTKDFDEQGKDEFEIRTGIKAKAFQKLLNSMYFEPFRIDGDDDLIPLLEACELLQLRHFKRRCEEYILANIDQLDASKLILVPELEQYERAYKCVEEFICLGNKLSKQLFSRLLFGQVKSILSSSYLIHLKKEDLFSYSQLWLCTDYPQRVKYVPDMTRLIFPCTWDKETEDKIAILDGKLHDESLFKLAYNGLLLDISSRISVNDVAIGSSKTYMLGEGDAALCFSKVNGVDAVIKVDVITHEQEVGDNKMLKPVYDEDIPFPTMETSLESVTGTVFNENMYMCARNGKGSSFHMFNREGCRKWNNLRSTAYYVKNLVACSSRLYSHQEKDDKSIHLAVYENYLERWFALPTLKASHESEYIEVACDEKCLFVVGDGANVIEFYDHRCNDWHSISSANDYGSVQPYFEPEYFRHKRCVFVGNNLFMFHGYHSYILDLRTRNWIQNLEENPFLFDADDVSVASTSKNTLCVAHDDRLHEYIPSADLWLEFQYVGNYIKLFQI